MVLFRLGDVVVVASILWQVATGFSSLVIMMYEAPSPMPAISGATVIAVNSGIAIAHAASGVVINVSSCWLGGDFPVFARSFLALHVKVGTTKRHTIMKKINFLIVA